MSQPVVSISSCPTYNESRLRHSLEEVVRGCGGLEQFLCRGERVLVKPNMLAHSRAGGAVTTHSAFVRVLIEILQEAGARVYVGDSPGRGSTESVAQSCGIRDVADKTGAVLLPFEEGIEVEYDSASVCRTFFLSREALEMDLVINAAKLKTHPLTGLTGAVKNCMGLIVGAEKKKLHARYPSVYDFAEMLIDLYLLSKPVLSIVDAVVAMEGPGPRSGRPRPLGVIAASEDAVALDAVCAALAGFSLPEVSTLMAAQKRGLAGSSLENIIIRGPLPGELRDKGFDKGASGRGWSFLWRIFPAWSRNLKERFRPWPCIEDSCNRCGICREHCPTGAIYDWNKGFENSKPFIDYKECLRCYCCQEICPQGAVILRPRRPRQR